MENQLKPCINEKISQKVKMINSLLDNYKSDLRKFDYFDSISKLEIHLLNNGHLESRSSNSYHIFIDQVSNDRLLIESVNQIVNSNEFISFMSLGMTTSTTIYGNCLLEHYQELQDKDEAKKRRTLYENWIRNGKLSKKDLDEYSDLTDFDNDFERLLLCNLIYLKLLRKLNESDADSESDLIEKDGLFYERQ
ncbi:hypothetical protein [Luteirhabdus pelagi]|uniref:hypothetical protein n=1 Tax=Luteirhabdus pelagi TaxID=2792783 RepID=UPI00193A91D0|nr:hypothetical protein [Luteirhabdus pelagi]